MVGAHLVVGPTRAGVDPALAEVTKMELVALALAADALAAVAAQLGRVRRVAVLGRGSTQGLLVAFARLASELKSVSVTNTLSRWYKQNFWRKITPVLSHLFNFPTDTKRTEMLIDTESTEFISFLLIF